MGSITKMAVGAMAAELHVEGALDLDAPPAGLDGTLPHLDPATGLRHLLQHTSGLEDYVADPNLLTRMDERWAPEELLALIADDPLRAPPGSDHYYANSNYVAAGMAIQAETGTPWHTHVRERFVDPLDLQRMGFPTAEHLPGELVSGYFGDGPSAVETNGVDPSIAWAAGEMVASSDELATLVRALVMGEVMSEAGHALWLEPAEVEGGTFPYGLGVELDDGRVGHSGSILGFQSRAWVDPGDGDHGGGGAEQLHDGGGRGGGGVVGGGGVRASVATSSPGRRRRDGAPRSSTSSAGTCEAPFRT